MGMANAVLLHRSGPSDYNDSNGGGTSVERIVLVCVEFAPYKSRPILRIQLVSLVRANPPGIYKLPSTLVDLASWYNLINSGVLEVLNFRGSSFNNQFGPERGVDVCIVPSNWCDPAAHIQSGHKRTKT